MNTNWIPHPTIIEGEQVTLIPLEEKHFEALFEVASDTMLWEHYPIDCSNKETFVNVYATALTEREKGNEYPFVVFHKPSGSIIGSTRLMDIHPEHRKLEIGWTWIAGNYWHTTVNLECKLLLLTFCFETLKTIRVQLKTKDSNIRSRKAILKIGASFEGILRKDRIQQNGVIRNSAYFSILEEEWKTAKSTILMQISWKQNKNQQF